MSISFICSPALGHQAQIYGGTGCIHAPQLEEKITDILNTMAPDRDDTRELTARMALSLSADNLSLSIKLTNQFGRVALARRYQLHRADCPDVPALIQLVLEEFLREFPENPWQIDADAEVITDQEQQLSSTRLRLGIAMLGEVNPVSPKLETNATLQGLLLPKVQWTAGLILRANLPQSLAQGGYQRTELLMGAGVTMAALELYWDLQISGGVYIVSGSSFASNRIAMAPALEAVASTRWKWGALSVGPSLSLALLQHQLKVLPENEEYPISILNIGLTIQYDII